MDEINSEQTDEIVNRPTVGVGVWSEKEDNALRAAVEKYGVPNWTKIANQVPNRDASQCSGRWKGTLDPNIRKGLWTEEEDKKLIDMVAKHGE